MYDVAREQSPGEDLLSEVLARSQSAGYNAVGLYLEHRFAYPSAPWAAGPGCLKPEIVRRLQATFRPSGLRMIPFLNTLGHMEGFIRSEGGQWLAEGPAGFGGVQICATRPECRRFARDLVADICAVFDDEWVHLGGDETRQLGQCPRCAERIASVGPGGLYADYFGPLCRFVLERGRRPCLWGDMLLKYPDALEALPKETIIFDWQYFGSPLETSRLFRRKGFDVVCCPSIQTYNSGWCFLAESQANIDAHAAAAAKLHALGVLVTTWEFCYFSQCLSTLPLVYAAGRRLARGDQWKHAIEAEGGPGYAQAADILGNLVPRRSRFLAPGTWRNLRRHLVMTRDPFDLWRAWRDDACGPIGDAILSLCDQAEAALQREHPLRWAIELHRVGIQFVRAVERAATCYTAGDMQSAAGRVLDAAAVLNTLKDGLQEAAENGGSAADMSRLKHLASEVLRAAERIKAQTVARGYRPAFDVVIRPDYTDNDQASWTILGTGPPS